MNNKRRRWVLLAVAVVMTACTSVEVAPSSATPQNTVAVPPTVQTTSPPAITTTSVPESPTVITPWGPVGDRAHLTVILPDGWEAQDGFVRISTPGDRPNWMAVGSSVVANIYSDNCRGTLLDPAVGPTVGDLAAAFKDVWGADATTPIDVTLDGFVGRRMVLTVPPEADFAECTNGRFMAWNHEGGGDRWLQGPGQIEEVWILDVDGERLLIRASYFPEASASDRAELQEVIDSIQIEQTNLRPTTFQPE